MGFGFGAVEIEDFGGAEGDVVPFFDRCGGKGFVLPGEIIEDIEDVVANSGAGAEILDEGVVSEFSGTALTELAREVDGDRGRIGEGPGAGSEPVRCVAFGEGVCCDSICDGVVDALDIGGPGDFDIGGELVDHVGVLLGGVLFLEGGGIGGDGAGAEDFGHLPERGSAGHFELPESVFGNGLAHEAECFGLGLGFDHGDAVRVAGDGGGLGEENAREGGGDHGVVLPFGWYELTSFREVMTSCFSLLSYC